MHMLASLLLRFPTLGASVMGLAGCFFSYIWYADRQEPVAEVPLPIGFPIAFWIAAAAFACTALYKKHYLRFAKPLADEGLRPLPASARRFALSRTDAYGATSVFVFLVTDDHLRVWKLNRGTATRLLEAFNRGLYPHGDPAPTLDLPFARLGRITQVSNSTVVFRHQGQDGKIRNESLNVLLEAGDVFSGLASLGWVVQADPHSRALHDYEFKHNAGFALFLSLASSGVAAVQLFPNPLVFLAVPGIFGLGASLAWVATQFGSKEANFVLPPTNERATAEPRDLSLSS